MKFDDNTQDFKNFTATKRLEKKKERKGKTLDHSLSIRYNV